MIKNYKVSKKQVFKRMKDKTQEQSFINYIYKNTNLSQIESQVVYEQFSEVFLNNNRQKMKAMQTIFIATKVGAKKGKKVEDSEYGEVIITLHDDKDDKIREDPVEFSNRYNFVGIDSTTAVRRNKLLRITKETYRQGCVLTEEDLAYKLFNCGIRTIQRDIAAYKRSGITIPIRGVVCDIGRSMTHKVEAVKGLLEGKEITTIARSIYHSPGAVERYLSKFMQIYYSIEKGLKEPEISFLTSTSYSLINEYKKIYEKAKKENKLELIKEYIRDKRYSPPKKNDRRE